MSLWKELKDFALKGNLVQTAVGITVGVAFVALVTALIKDIITPLISVPGSVNFSNSTYKLGNGLFLQGDFLNAVIAFVVIILVVFFAIVKPMATLQARQDARKPKAEPSTKVCPFCLSEIPLKATRCKECTSQLPA